MPRPLDISLIPPDLAQRAVQAKTRVDEARQRAAGALARHWRCGVLSCDGKPHKGRMIAHARGKQVLRGWLPDDNWPERHRVAFVRGGRGSGKTWTAAHHLAELIVTSPPGEWAVVGPTFADARDVCMEHQTSGLVAALGGKMGGEGRLVEKGPNLAAYNRSNGQLRLVSGSVVYSDGANDGADRIQGHDLRGVWGDEIGLWMKWHVAYDESIRYAVRQPPAKVIITGTPKRTRGARQLVERLMHDENVLNVALFTEENLSNLDPVAAAEFMANIGTSLERQELYGELLEEVEGALWTLEVIDRTRVLRPKSSEDDPFAVQAIFDLIQPARIGIAIDPAVSFSETSDEHGIIVVAKGADGDIYLLEDASFRGPVTQWPRRVIELSERWHADRVIGEVNNGGDYIGATLRSGGYSGGYETIRASRGKMTRAEPVATFWEQGHVHIVGYMPELEDQLATWVPGEQAASSPDRLDAMVYGCGWLVPRLATGWDSLYLPDDQVPVPSRASGWAAVYAAEKR